MNQCLVFCASSALGLLALSPGCIPEQCNPYTLVVMDAHGEPPATGFAILTRPASMDIGGLPLAWEVVSDTMYWNLESGQVTLPFRPLTNTWWSVQALDPTEGGRWRQQRFNVAEKDTVRFSMSIPYRVLTRLNRTIGPEISHYSLESSSPTDPASTAALCFETSGNWATQGRILTSSFPATLRLVRHHTLTDDTHVAASTTIEYWGSETAFDARWSDLDSFRLQP